MKKSFLYLFLATLFVSVMSLQAVRAQDGNGDGITGLIEGQSPEYEAVEPTRAIPPSREKISCEAGSHQVFQRMNKRAALLHWANKLDQLYAIEKLVNEMPGSELGGMGLEGYYKDYLEKRRPTAEIVFRRLAGAGARGQELSPELVEKVRANLLDSGKLKKGLDYKITCVNDVKL